MDWNWRRQQPNVAKVGHQCGRGSVGDFAYTSTGFGSISMAESLLFADQGGVILIILESARKASNQPEAGLGR
jgi:hypothetical protein